MNSTSFINRITIYLVNKSWFPLTSDFCVSKSAPSYSSYAFLYSNFLFISLHLHNSVSVYVQYVNVDQYNGLAAIFESHCVCHFAHYMSFSLTINQLIIIRMLNK